MSHSVTPALVAIVAFIWLVIGSISVWSNSDAGARDYRTKVDFNETFSDAAKGTVNSTPRTREALRDAGWRFLNFATK